MERERIILGIDPGTQLLGFGVVQVFQKKASYVDMGVLDLRKEADAYTKLQAIYDCISEVCKTYHPTELAIETQFVDKNVQTMLKLAHGQGVAIAAALSKDIPVNEYSPMKIKMAITGNGHATKEMVADMLQRVLKLEPSALPKKLDATDALAIAYCHFLQLGLPLRTGKPVKNWAEFARQNASRIHK